MPYRKFYRRRRRPIRRSRTYKSKSNLQNYASMAKTALKTAKFVKSIINAEAKYYDVSVDTTIGTTESVTLLNNPGQGTTAITRNGDSIKSKSITINYAINKNLDPAAANPLYFDAYLIYTKDSGAPTLSNLFVNPTAPWVSMRKKDHMHDWKIIDARHFVMSTVDNSTSKTGTIHKKLYFHTRFLTGTSIIDDGSLYLVLICNNNTYPTAVSFKCRYTYYDN